jgi:hypothetical protein
MPRSPEVDAWLDAYDNPMKPVVLRVRAVLLELEPRLGECIKWQAPTFTYGGNLASFFPRAKQRATLMFHTGASIPGDFPRLVGDGDTARSMSFDSLDEVEAARDELGRIAAAWCDARDAEAAAKATKKAGTKKAGTKKAGTKKAGTKKAATKKAGTKKAATKKAATKKAATKKAATEKAATKKAATKKAAIKKRYGR